MRIFKQQFMVTYFAKFIKFAHYTHPIFFLQRLNKYPQVGMANLLIVIIFVF